MKILPVDPFVYSGLYCPFTGVAFDFQALECGEQTLPEGSIVMGVIDCRGDTPEVPETRSDWFDTRWRDLYEDALQVSSSINCEALVQVFDFPDGLALKLNYPADGPVETYIVVRSSAWREGLLLYANDQETPARTFG